MVMGNQTPVSSFFDLKRGQIDGKLIHERRSGLTNSCDIVLADKSGLPNVYWPLTEFWSLLSVFSMQHT